MKNKSYIFIALFSFSLFAAHISNAAFPVKKNIASSEVVAQQPAQTETASATESATASSELITTNESHAAKKHSFFSRIFNRISKAEEDAAIPEILYIILAIIGLGWLAMGINDSFGDFDWVISLILYCIFYIPGLIYTLIKLGKYY